jgi:nitroreductase
MIYQKMTSRRTIRKYAPKAVPKEVLLQCVDAARLSPSAANRQPLKYVIVNDNPLLRDVFQTLSWAGYLPEYQPSEAEMPQAYIVILLDKDLRKEAGHDAGIAAMSITMVAHDNGLGSCILGAINRRKLRTVLNLPESLVIILVVAIGHPAEIPALDEVTEANIKYWLDQTGVLHVPKRALKDIVRWNRYHTT